MIPKLELTLFIINKYEDLRLSFYIPFNMPYAYKHHVSHTDLEPTITRFTQLHPFIHK